MRRILVIGMAAVTLGCSSRPSRIQSIDIDPGSLSRQLIAEYDSDGNGTLSAVEIQEVPPIHGSRSKYDSDGNGEISTEELESRLKRIFDPNVGLLPASCRVTRNGQPLSDAVVRFVPPKLLEGVLPPASCTTSSDGSASLNLAPEDMPKNFPSTRVRVMRPGIYLVEVTHPSVQVPRQYNAQTTLGKEVFGEVLNGPPLAIELKF
jgi:hypothetical protein